VWDLILMRADSDFAPVRFDFKTDALPPNKRVPLWRDAFMRQVVHANVQPQSQESFRGEAVVQALPGLRLTSFKSAPARLTRSSEMVADGDNDLVLLVPSKGHLCAVQRGREATLRPGEALLLLHEESAALIHDNVRFQGFIFPRAALAARMGDIDAATMRAIPRSNGPLRLLLRYVDLVRSESALEIPAVRRNVVTHIQDLAALALDANRETREHAMSAAAAARVAVALEQIAQGFTNAEISLKSVAHGLGISSRYLQRLLEASGTSFITRVNEFRLQKVLAMLVGPNSDKRRIADIAMDAGFSDISHFNRLFRARFGDSPSGVRGRGKP
jgi:AraC-like DNA-binding protein